MRSARPVAPKITRPGTLGVRCVLAAGVVCLLAGAGLWVAQPVTANSPTEGALATVDDIQLTLETRQALDQDPRLKPLNLWVSVRGRTATLTGPVPSTELARLAEDRVRGVSGLVKVVNELRPEREEDAAVNAMQPLARSRPPAADPRHTTARPKMGVLTGQPPPRPQSAAASGSGDFLKLPPIRLTVPSTEPVGTSVAKPRVADAADRQSDLAGAIERVRQAEERFRDLRAEVVDGAVFLRGVVRDPADQFDLAQRLAQLPGVTRVVLAEVRVVPAHPTGRDWR